MMQRIPTNVRSLLALIDAVIYLAFFHIVNGKPASGEHAVSQKYILPSRQLLTRLFSVDLCSSLTVAFAQHLWRVLRTDSVKVSYIELPFWHYG
jgi:hypothetical protein